MYGIAYHGTCRRFKSFDIDMSCPDNFFGKGVYLTSEVNDANVNYNRAGPDRSFQIDYLKEKAGLSTLQARNKLGLNHGRTFILKCAFTMKKPFYISKEKSPYFQCSQKQLDKCLKEMEYLFPICFDNLKEELWSVFEGIQNYKLHSIMKDCLYWNSGDDDERDNFTEFFQRFLQWFGYDGIVQKPYDFFPSLMRRVGDKGFIKHYILFNPKQVLITESQKL